MGFFDTETKKVENRNLTTQSNPWAASIPGLQLGLSKATGLLQNSGLTQEEQDALQGLSTNSAAGNPFAGGINDATRMLLAGGGPDRTGIAQSAYDAYKTQLSPYATMDTNPYSNPAFSKFASGLTGDITDQIKAQYAGAGYSPTSSGDFSKTLGEGIARGLSPAWLQASNDLESRKLGAIGGLYSGGNTTAGLLGGMDQTALGNRVAGIGAADAATTANNLPYLQALQIAQQRRAIPGQAIAQGAGLIVPMAQLGGTQNQQGTIQTNSSTPFNFNDLAGLFKGGNSSSLAGMANAGSAALGFLSDRDEKTDIKKIGTSEETGLDIFSYRYKGDPKTYPKMVGPMAQDIEKNYPGSTETIGGTMYVKPQAAGLLGAI